RVRAAGDAPCRRVDLLARGAWQGRERGVAPVRGVQLARAGGCRGGLGSRAALAAGPATRRGGRCRGRHGRGLRRRRGAVRALGAGGRSAASVRQRAVPGYAAAGRADEAPAQRSRAGFRPGGDRVHSHPALISATPASAAAAPIRCTAWSRPWTTTRASPTVTIG